MGGLLTDAWRLRYAVYESSGLARAMIFAYDEIEQRHTRAGHPENSGRLSNTVRELKASGWWERARRIEPTRETELVIELAHPPEYRQRVERIATGGGGQLDADTYVGPDSYRAAAAAVGCLAAVVEAVTSEAEPTGFALVRPPGHHAERARGMGFCLFSTVAIGALHAVQNLGIERVLIIDWDVHHGNGTENILYEDPRIGFFSVHQYPFYPGTGALTDRGAGAGTGSTLNVPIPPGVGDSGYRAIFEAILRPFAERIQPELILVSAGYDAHHRDPLAQESLSLQGFAELQRIVSTLAAEHAGGRLVLALEGGYDQVVLPQAVLNSWSLLDNPNTQVEDPFGDGSGDETPVESVLATIREQENF